MVRLIHNMSHSQLVYIFLFFTTGPGIRNNAVSWYRLVIHCQGCTRLVTHQEGIFCVNFGRTVIGSPTCLNAWCATCYQILPGNNFSIYHVDNTTDEEGNVDLVAPEEDDDYKHARPGDHLFCPFECDFCTFYHLKGHAPIEGNKVDEVLQVYIRCTILDAFWSRRPGTITANLGMFTRQVGVGEQFGFEMFPHPGPFRRSYDSGIRFAIGMLWESKQPGQHELTMKFSSCRKVCSLHYNMYNASVAGVTVTMVWCSKWQHFVTTTLASDSEFASHFIIGCRASMGEKVNLDTAISICQMLALQALFQREYEEAVSEGDLTEQRRVCV